jgi:hypothetical protein
MSAVSPNSFIASLSARAIPVAALLLLVGCGTPPPPERDIAAANPDSSASPGDSLTQGVTPPQEPRPVLLEPEQWPGTRFVLVEKVKMFRRFGYQLYTSADLDADRRPPNPAIELDNHRLKYDVFAGTAVTATAVERQVDGEYLVTFKTDTLGLTVYGRTSGGIIEGIHPEADLAAARERWLDRTVFSRRRIVDAYDSAASRFSTVKVSMTEPLRVNEVRWGMTPLPPKPIWLMVRRPDGSRGIIPVNYSWTNVPPGKRTGRVPWAMDILEEDPRTYGWPEEVWEAIDESKILTGMSERQVVLSWGEPTESRSRLSERGEKVRELLYPGNKLLFQGDTLVSGKPGEGTNPWMGGAPER